MSSFAYRLYGERVDLRPAYTPHDQRGLAAWRGSLHAQGIRVVAVGPYGEGVPSEVSARLQQLDRPGSGFARVAGEDPLAEPLLYQVK
jgi:hypothetical protein